MTDIDRQLARQYAALTPGELLACYTIAASGFAWRNAGDFTTTLIAVYAFVACVQFGQSIPLPREPRW